MNTRRRLLWMVEEGRLTPEEALRLWRALTPQEATSPSAQVVPTLRKSTRPKEQIRLLAGFRVLPWVVGGVGLFCFGGTFWAAMWGGAGWLLGLLCLLPVGLLGLLALGVVWAAWRGAWVRVEIRRPEDEAGQPFRLALPLPVGWLPLAFRLARPWIGEALPLEGRNLRQMLQVLRQEPLWLTVDDEDGTQVQVWIGGLEAATN